MAGTFSVWALAPPAHPILQPAVEHLQQLFGGPALEPHVTVLGAVNIPLEEACAKLQDLARSLRPLSYQVQGVSAGKSYFQCVYLTLEPTKQILEANIQARECFGLPAADHSEDSTSGCYMPHLSLLYGDLDEEIKEKAKQRVNITYGNSLNGLKFEVSKLSLYSTNPEDKLLTTWQKVVEYPLEGK